MAHTSILLTIYEPCGATIIDEREPIKMWQQLREIYHTISIASVDDYMWLYQETKMTIEEKVLNHLNGLAELENKLAAFGQPQKDDWKEEICR